jgi:1-acyl-sn-glycerol-3-phosphate acyltransferase
MIILRSALFNVVFYLVTFGFTVAGAIVNLFAPERVMGLVINWARTLVFATRVICGIHVEVTGREHIAPGAALIVSRHQSAFDTFVWLTLLPRCCYVLKQELMRIPVFGSLLVATRMIPIDRKAGSGAIRALLKEGDRAVREERQIVIFPEGTRSDPGQPKELQPGFLALASRTGLPVIPVATDSGTYWGRRAFRKRPGTIHILIGQPIPPTADRRALQRQVETGIGVLDQRVAIEAPASA